MKLTSASSGEDIIVLRTFNLHPPRRASVYRVKFEADETLKSGEKIDTKRERSQIAKQGRAWSCAMDVADTPVKAWVSQSFTLHSPFKLDLGSVTPYEFPLEEKEKLRLQIF